MTAATLFSGIGAPEVAMPGWRWLWHAEIEPFPAAVMAKRHPESINLGDVTADDFCERALAIGRPDVLVFGSPCQSYSVAGRRLGLDDPRGNLALVALGIVERIAPAWFVFENVPGLFSSYSGADEAARQVRDGAIGATAEGDEDSDFAAFLSAVCGIGYCGSWAVLDAQYRGVAQRRERVFFVGGPAPAWQRAAAVLLEPESLCGHPPARGQAGEDVAGTLRAGAGGGCHPGPDEAAQGMLIAPAVANVLTHRMHKGINTTLDEGQTLIAHAVAPPVTNNPYGDHESREGLLVAHALSADGFDASEDGTGRGTPLVPVVASTLKSNHGGGFGSDPSETFVPVAFTMKDYGADAGEIAPTLRSGGHDQSHANGGVMPAVAFGWNKSSQQTMTVREELTDPLKASKQSEPAVAVQEAQTGVREYDTAGSLRANGPGHDPVGTRIRSHAGVRRLMPDECERLQGFRRNYTLITYRGKRAKDGPRYKAIGNSMAVPVVRWILARIDWLDRNVPQERKATA